MILQPLTVNSYWSDIDNDGDKDWVQDPSPEDSWWEEDGDGDQMTNAEEALFGSDPYRIDSDFDGLTDRDERDLTPPMIDGVTSTNPWLWDSDSDGYSDHDEFYHWLHSTPFNVNYSSLPSGFTFASYYDADGDSLPNLADALPFDRDNDGMMDHEDSWPDDPNNIQDDDGDGVANELDSHPTDSGLQSDWDNDGHNLGDDTHPENSYLWSDSDGDGYNSENDSHPANSSLWSDWNQDGDNNNNDGDEDGTADGSDSHPHNPAFWDDWDGDGWSGGSTQYGDSHPSDSNLWSDWDNNGTNNDEDVDQDNVLNAEDSHPTDQYLYTDWNGDGDNSSDDWDEDGNLNSNDSHPKDANLWCDWDYNGTNDPGSLDDDGDSWINSNDSHPENSGLWSDWNDNTTNNDTDGDEDGHANESDSHPRNPNLWCDWNNDSNNDPESLDSDSDGHSDANDSHPADYSLWSDWDGNYLNNDSDGDEDGQANGADSHPRNAALWCDWNNDGTNDPESLDTDTDGYSDANDSHPQVNYLWSDWNNDGDNNEDDGDEDGYANGSDTHPRNQGLWVDFNGDGTNDAELVDTDFDSWLDINDSHPYSNSYWSDWNGDGDNNDSDGDEDNIPNEQDSDPRDPSLWSDWNSDGDNSDDDYDEDGWANASDSHPYDPSWWTDWDNNGINDNSDVDGDSHLNDDDSHPTNNSLWSDWNGDGDNNDTDGDEDTVADIYDSHPRNAARWDDMDDDGYNIGEDSHPEDGTLWEDFDNNGWNDSVQNADDDGDGLTNYQETVTHNTNRYLVDTDGDYLTDYEELMIFATNPLAIRTTPGQTEVDFYYVQSTQSTAFEDDDDDQIPNAVERWFGLNPNDPADASGIIGGGALTNLQRYQQGISLLDGLSILDTDGDGITNAMEDYYNVMSPGSLNKLRFNDAVEDPDSDGVNNYDEVRSGLNLLNAHSITGSEDYTVFVQRMNLAHVVKGTGDGDADNDTIPDFWEHRYRTLTHTAADGMDLHNALDAAGNLDGDIFSNLVEYQTWRHPLVVDPSGAVPAPTSPADPHINSGTAPPLHLQPSTSPGTSNSGDFNFVHLGSSDSNNEDPPPEGVQWRYRIVERDKNYNVLGNPQWRIARGPVEASLDSLPTQCEAVIPIESVSPITENQTKCGCQHGTTDRFVAINGANGYQWLGINYTMQNPPLSMTQNYCDNAYAKTWSKEVEIYISRQVANPNAIVRGFSAEGRFSSFSADFIWTSELEISSNATGEPAGASFHRHDLLHQGAFVILTPDFGDAEDAPPSPFSVGDAAGPRYRKVGLNGIPMPDSKPQVQNENGEEEEETYIDAFSAQLRHSVSDVYVTDEATLLPLTVRRDVASDAWNDRHGLRPDERPNQPFGPGWQSNICSHVRFDYTDDTITANVVDESGGSQRFLNGGGALWHHDGQEARDMKSFMNRLTTDNPTFPVLDNMIYTVYNNIKLVKKFGTVCEYQTINPGGTGGFRQLYRGDRIKGDGGYTTHLYARLTKVTDRMGNVLLYEYPPNSSTLIPSRIHDPARAGHQILIQEDGGRVIRVRGPGGDTITYEYGNLAGELPADGASGVLLRVKKNAGGTDMVQYGYFMNTVHVNGRTDTIVTENEVIDPLVDKPVRYTNLELASIMDERGGIYSFTYQPNYSVASWGGDSMVTAWGQPMFLTDVTSPLIGTTHIDVTDHGGIPFGKDNPRLSMGSSNFSPPGVRVRILPAGAQKPYFYVFSDPEVIPLIGSSTQTDHSTMGYKKMVITTPDKVQGTAPDYAPADSGVETYFYDYLENRAEHDSTNSMVLTCVRDRNGRDTVFEYGDSPPDMDYPYDDPTRETSTSGGHTITKTMVYDSETRILKSTTVSRSSAANDAVITEYQVDGLGRRIAETVKGVNGSSISGGRKQTFLHGYVDENGVPDANVLLPGFVREQRLTTPQVRPTTDGPTNTVPMESQVPEVVTKRSTEPKPADDDVNPAWWRTISETVQIHGENSTTTTWSDFNGNKRMVRDPRGHITTFDYDARHRLIRVTHPDDSFKALAYDAHGNLIQETDELGTATFHVYDALNRRIKTTLDLNRNGVPDARYTSVVNADVTAPLTSPASSPYNGDLVTETSYNRFNLPDTITDGRGVVTKLEYDLLGRLTKKTVNWRETPSTTDPAQVTTYEYKATGINGGLEAGSSVFDISGFRPVRVTDPRGFKTSFVYDGHYRQVQEIRPDADLPGGLNVSIIHKTYDDLGQVIKITEPCAPGASQAHQDYGATLTSYDALGNARLVTLPDGKTVETHYAPAGKPWKAKDEFGLWTFMEYNSAGLPVKSTVQVSTTNSALNPVTQTVYDLSGNPTTITNPLGHETRQIHDGRNRLVMTVLPPVMDASSTSTAPVHPVTQTTYDRLGRVIAVTDPLGAVTSSVYDPAGRVIASFDALNQRSRMRYDAAGQVLSTTNALNQTTSNVYSSLGFLTSTTDAAGIVNEFSYDVNGNRMSVKDGRGGTTTFSYDAFGRVIREKFADGTEWFSSYQAGVSGDVPERYLDLTWKGSISARNVGMIYDKRHRLVTRNAVNEDPANGGNRTSTLTYTDGRLTSVTDTGLSGAMPGAGIAENWNSYAGSAYTYDILGRLASETSLSQTHVHEYDLAGNRSKTTLKCGAVTRVITTSHDALGRPYIITDNNGTTATTTDDRHTLYGYDLAGRAVTLEEKIGTQTVNRTENGHDLIGRLKTRALSSGSTTLAAFSWEHDELGRVTHQQESWAASAGGSAARSRATTMSYDLAGRLNVETIAESGEASVSTTYSYDASNNRTGKLIVGGSEAGNTVCQFNAANQLVRTDKTFTGGAPSEVITYTYDPFGNRKQSSRVVGSGAAQETLYRWDALDKLVGVQMPDMKAYTYTYDYRSRRVAIGQDDAGGQPSKFTAVIFSGGLSVAEFVTHDSTGNIATGRHPAVQYIRGPDMGGGVGGLLYTVRNPLNASTGLPTAPNGQNPVTQRYNLSNGRGDIVAQSDSSGALTWTTSYEAFGKRTKETGANADKQRANTKDEDPTGLLNEGFRYRDIETGVWLSRDPAGFVDGPNLYAYVQQNPWTKFDPEGLFWGAIIGAGVDLFVQTVIEGNSLKNVNYARVAGAAAIGLVTGGASAFVARAAITASAKVAAVAAIGAAAGVAGNANSNIANGNEWHEGWKGAAVGGALGGVAGDAAGRLVGCAAGVVTKAVAGAATGGTVAAGEQIVSNVVNGEHWSNGAGTAFGIGAATGGIAGAYSKTCFLPGTRVLTTDGEQAIETVHVGMRACTPDSISSGQTSTQVDPASWREFRVQFRDAESGENDIWNVTLLRPMQWLQENSRKEGRQVWIKFDELKAEGWADVVEILPCPTLHGGKGRVITGTVTHQNNIVRSLTLSSGETLGVTAPHRMFSAERNDWVPVSELRTGEMLRTDKGTVSVAAVTANPGIHQVYNVEVESEHCYFVGETHTLTHNTYAQMQFGNKVHYDSRNGGTGTALPTALDIRYPQTVFRHTPRGQRGADVEIVGGIHPSDQTVYPGSTWGPANNYADFKPDTANGRKTVAREIRSGKLPKDTEALHYDPTTGALR
ncbi:RHS repeat-associated core domain-containing protein [Brevifollis gellanilyticus]|nr:RHS repeat-associated core domain-containing protein [Brevifollis gellanilyticus]